MELQPGIHAIRCGIVYAYLLFDQNDGLTLIDAGLPGNQARILDVVRKLGKKSTDLKRILITHADGDHYGSLQALKEATGAAVFAHPIESRSIRAGESSRPLQAHGIEKVLYGLVGRFFNTLPGPVDENLAPGAEFPVLGGLRTLDTPGHTPGHVSFYLPVQRALFSGDSIQLRGGRLCPSSGANTWDPQAAQLSYRAQAALGPGAVCGGHFLIKADAGSMWDLS